jgi:DNA recombination protein RmuC
LIIDLELILIILLAIFIISTIWLFILNSKISKKNHQLQVSSQQLEIQLVAYKQKLFYLEQNESKLKNEFQNIANEIFDQNSKKLSEQNSQNLGNILAPFKQQIESFRKKVEDVYDKESKDRTMLQAQLISLKELNIQLRADATNLTNALKGDNKQQGIWGEMVLQKVLENSGLRKDNEYFTEVALKDQSNRSYRPDVIVKLPNHRDIIIDAKTSLISYEQYINCKNDNEKELFLKEHIKSINSHIKNLSEKNYEDLKNINTLDFIFMFIPIESALIVALEYDKMLFDNAFKQKIVLVSPTTLLVALKAIENSWRYEKQAQNITEVMNKAQKLYTKFVNFTQDLENVGVHLQKATNSFEDAQNKLCTGKDNLVRQVETFKQKANIKPKKSIDKSLIEKSNLDLPLV